MGQGGGAELMPAPNLMSLSLTALCAHPPAHAAGNLIKKQIQQPVVIYRCLNNQRGARKMVVLLIKRLVFRILNLIRYWDPLRQHVKGQNSTLNK